MFHIILKLALVNVVAISELAFPISLPIPDLAFIVSSRTHDKSSLTEGNTLNESANINAALEKVHGTKAVGDLILSYKMSTFH